VFDKDEQGEPFETLILHTETEFTGNRTADYAWVIPVPRLPAPAEIATLPNGREAFYQLYYLTEPQGRIIGHDGDSWGCACGGGTAGGDGGTVYPGVNVVGELSIDGYDLALLEADDSRSLNTWLQDHDYAFPDEAADTLAYYVAKDWRFCAVKVDVAAAGGGGGGGQPLNPLQITFATDELVFPLRISNVSSRQERQNEILIYVFSDRRVRATRGFASVDMEMPDGPLASEEEFRSEYHRRFQQKLDAFGGRAFVVEYANWVSRYWLSGSVLRALFDPQKDYFLTRFRTILGRDDMSEDVLFVAASNNEPLELVRLIRSPEQLRVRWAMSGGLLGLATLLGAAGRSRRSFVRAYLAALLLMLAVI
jgi:hypothetical protein